MAGSPVAPQKVSSVASDTKLSERDKGAARASCGETVVQKGVFGESVSSLPKRFALKTPERF